MPKSCYECNLKIICDYASMNGWISNKRDSMCPLVEVKEPHGDLADKDKLMQEFMDSDLDHLQRDDWKEVIQIVSDAEVVIEAEGSEE